MADNYTMGLLGQNNPILQAAQQQNQQSAQLRNVAAEGIVNKTIAQETKKLAAQIDMWTKLATESTSPTVRNTAFQNLGSLVGTDFSDAMTDEETISELKDIRKVMSDKTGAYLPDKAKSLFDDFVARRGRDFIPKEEEKAFQGNLEQGYLTQGLAAQRQIADTPGLAENPEIMSYAQGEKDRLLTSGGTKGMEIAGRSGDGETEKNYTQTATLISPKDGKPHIYKYNPQTDRYDIDQGVASSTAYQEGIQNRSNEDKYLRTISLADNDDTVKQFRRTQQVTPYIEDAVKTFNATGNAGILQDALIYSHNKILDADSVVMVSEYLRARGMQSLVDKVQGNVYKLFDGSAGLSIDQQKIMLESVQNALKRKSNAYDQRMKSFRNTARRYNSNESELRETFPLSNEIFGSNIESNKTTSALPEGAKLIGTSGGKNVYQAPNGKKFLEE